jgi:hypothetical protein
VPTPDMRHKASTQLLLSLIIVVVLAVGGMVLMLINPKFDGLFFLGFGILMLLVLTSAPWFTLIVYAVLALRNEARLRVLEAAYAGATLIHAVITGPVLRQLRELAATLGMPRPKLHPRRYVTLAFDGSNIVLYGGSADPTALLTVPASTLASIDLATTPAAGKQLPSLRLVFTAGSEKPIVLVPVCWPGVAPKPVRQETLRAQIAANNTSRG